MGDIYLCESEFEDEFSLGSLQNMVYFLLAHGALHLLNWTHEIKEKYDKMIERQKNLVFEFNK